MALTWPDYTILLGFLAISLLIGVYHAFTGGRQKTTQEFVLANREQGFLPLSLSLAMSYLSALALLGNTAEMYTRGTLYLIVVAGAMVLSGIISHRLIIPWLYPLELLSVYEYLELRFSSKLVRQLASVIGAIWSTMYSGLVILATSFALQTATDVDTNYWIPIVTIVSTVYTAMGGMRAVVWTDVFQCIIMLAGISAIIIKGCIAGGGMKNVFATCEKTGRLEWINFDPNPQTRMTTWGVFGLGLHFIYAGCLQQGAYQRLTATKKIETAYWIMIMNIAIAVVTVITTCLMGILAYAFFAQKHCDPMVNGEIGNPNQGLYVKNLFKDYHGFEGFFLAVVNSGSLSTVSTSISGTATNIWEDILKRKMPMASEQKATLILKVLVVFVGCCAAAIAFLSANVGGPLTQVAYSFLGVAVGPLIGIFFLGGLSRSADSIGAISGGAVSLVISLWICLSAQSLDKRVHKALPPLPTNGCMILGIDHNGIQIWSNVTASYIHPTELSYSPNHQNISVEDPYKISGIENLYAVSFVWYSLIGAVSCFIIGLTASCIVQRIIKGPENVPDNLFINWRTVFLCGRKKTDNTRYEKRVQHQELNTLDLETNNLF